MYGHLPLGHDLQICLRCQLFRAIRPRPKVPKQLPSGPRTLRQHATSSLRSDARRGSGSSIRHLDLRDHEVELGVNALGKPAKIRIVRDRPPVHRGSARQEKKPKITENAQVKESSTSREALRRAIAGDSSELGEDAFQANIDSIKASYLATKEEGDLRKFHCAALARQLVDGFKTSQLKAYLKITQSRKQESGLHNLDTYHSKGKPRTFRRSRWFGGQSDFPRVALRRTNPKTAGKEKDRILLVGGASQRLTSKQQLVESILRKSWNVRSHEEKEYGELDIQIPPASLAVLLKNYESVFESRARHFNVKINISDAHGIIRLSGNYDLTSDVFDLIYNSIRSIGHDRLALSQSLSHLPEESLAEVLDEVGKLTCTHILFEPSSRKLHVYSLGPSNTALLNVERLLSQFDESKPPRQTHIRYERLSSGETGFTSPIIPTSTLPLHERFFEWQRLIYGQLAQPSARTKQDSTEGSQSIPKTLATHGEGRVNRARPLDSELPQLLGLSQERLPDLIVANSTTFSLYWRSRLESNLSAQLGYAVHSKWMQLDKPLHVTSRIAPVKLISAINERKFTNNHVRSALISNVPGLAQLIESNDFGIPNLDEEFVVTMKPLNLAMASGVESDITGDFMWLPWLRLHIGIDAMQRQVTLKLASLVCQTEELDLLLPSKPADLRLEAEKCLSSSKEIDPAIAKFIRESELDIWGTGRLQTPPRLSISIPDMACSHLPESVATKLEKDGSHEIPAVYIFQHLEHHSHMIMDYEGHSLRYSTVEAGRARGRRQEMRVTMDPKEWSSYMDVSEESSKDGMARFVDTMRELVSKIPQ